MGRREGRRREERKKEEGGMEGEGESNAEREESYRRSSGLRELVCYNPIPLR